jgi:hypothetical protein
MVDRRWMSVMTRIEIGQQRGSEREDDTHECHRRETRYKLCQISKLVGTRLQKRMRKARRPDGTWC